jgi:Domain of unknown function (DUF1905)
MPLRRRVLQCGTWPALGRATMRAMRVQRFGAHVGTGPRVRAVIAVPFDPDEAWGAKAEHPVAGTINGTRVRGAIAPTGGGWAFMEHMYEKVPGGTRSQHVLYVPGVPMPVIGRWLVPVVWRPKDKGQRWIRHAIEEMRNLPNSGRRIESP